MTSLVTFLVYHNPALICVPSMTARVDRLHLDGSQGKAPVTCILCHPYSVLCIRVPFMVGILDLGFQVEAQLTCNKYVIYSILPPMGQVAPLYRDCHVIAWVY